MSECKHCKKKVERNGNRAHSKVPSYADDNPQKVKRTFWGLFFRRSRSFFVDFI